MQHTTRFAILVLSLGLLHPLPSAPADLPVGAEVRQAQEQQRQALAREQRQYRDAVEDLPVLEQMRIERQLDQQRLEQGLLHQRQRAEAALLRQRMRSAPDRAPALNQLGRARFDRQLEGQRQRFDLERRAWSPAPRFQGQLLKPQSPLPLERRVWPPPPSVSGR